MLFCVAFLTYCVAPSTLLCCLSDLLCGTISPSVLPFWYTVAVSWVRKIQRRGGQAGTYTLSYSLPRCLPSSTLHPQYSVKFLRKLIFCHFLVSHLPHHCLPSATSAASSHRFHKLLPPTPISRVSCSQSQMVEIMIVKHSSVENRVPAWKYNVSQIYITNFGNLEARNISRNKLFECEFYI